MPFCKGALLVGSKKFFGITQGAKRVNRKGHSLRGSKETGALSRLAVKLHHRAELLTAVHVVVSEKSTFVVCCEWTCVGRFIRSGLRCVCWFLRGHCVLLVTSAWSGPSLIEVSTGVVKCPVWLRQHALLKKLSTCRRDLAAAQQRLQEPEAQNKQTSRTTYVIIANYYFCYYYG